VRARDGPTHAGELRCAIPYLCGSTACAAARAFGINACSVAPVFTAAAVLLKECTEYPKKPSDRVTAEASHRGHSLGVVRQAYRLDAAAAQLGPQSALSAFMTTLPRR
jgi:hypothetical protein